MASRHAWVESVGSSSGFSGWFGLAPSASSSQVGISKSASRRIAPHSRTTRIEGASDPETPEKISSDLQDDIVKHSGVRALPWTMEVCCLVGKLWHIFCVDDQNPPCCLQIVHNWNAVQEQVLLFAHRFEVRSHIISVTQRCPQRNDLLSRWRSLVLSTPLLLGSTMLILPANARIPLGRFLLDSRFLSSPW